MAYTGTPTLDGHLSMLSQTTWAAARGSTSATENDTTSTTATVRAEQAVADVYHVSRVFLTFSLSSIPNGAVIQSSTLAVNAQNVVASDANLKTAHLVESTQASSSSLANGDIDNYGTTNFATPIELATGSNTFTLNTDGINYLKTKLGSNAVLCIMMKKDFDNTSPSVGDGRSDLNTVETSTKPTLTINYTLGGGAFFVTI